MKYIVILGDGMADEPIPQLGGLTPLQYANKPFMDMLAREGRCGMLDTIPPGYSPGSEIANLSVLGYDVPRVYEGRGSLEAASMGIEIGSGEMAMRCNLITIDENLIKNHSAGHISTEEAAELINALQEKLGGEVFGEGLSASFHAGISYRHLLKIKGGNKDLVSAAPHDHLDKDYRKLLPKAGNRQAENTAIFLNRLIERSREILSAHPVNIERVRQGKAPANSIWPWSPGYRPRMETLAEKYGLEKSSVISAVDLIKGIGVYAGAEIIEVEGATGLYDTNYEGKAAAAIDSLRHSDFVFLHIEASDEAGHEGDPQLKARTIEYLDDRILKPIFSEVSGWDEPVRIAVLPDHPTPCAIRTHTADPVPFLIYGSGIEPDSVEVYDEFAPRQGGYGLLVGEDFMNTLLA
ncbi:MAG: cofactor-independent phosphoglycerate mutase [Alistipes sp.]|nr:cofactor-independent phosphoglycerate mutase [Alistipes sp.]